MTLEEVIREASAGPGPIKVRKLPEDACREIAKAVRDFLLSDEVVRRVSAVIDEQSGDIYWAVEYGRSFDFDALSRAALSSITGDE